MRLHGEYNIRVALWKHYVNLLLQSLLNLLNLLLNLLNLRKFIITLMKIRAYGSKALQ